MNKTFKKLTCGVLAAISAFGCAATMTACESNRPEVEMQIAFNGKTYTLNYTLYRKTAPATVEHFLFLAGNGYYDGLCVHDYDDDRLYSGGYSVTTEAPTTLVYKKYFDVIKGYKNYNEFPVSVWTNNAKTTPLYTLKGEFESNNVTVKSGALEEKFGSLAMYYDDIDSETYSKAKVYTKSASEEGKVNKGDYQYNHTTSKFFLSLTTSSKTNNGYCTFATLNEKSQDELEDLKEALTDYISDNYADDEDSFTQEVTVHLFEDDAMMQGITQEEEYELPKTPIVFNKVKVKKY